jgi:hypothetical protein
MGWKDKLGIINKIKKIKWTPDKEENDAQQMKSSANGKKTRFCTFFETRNSSSLSLRCCLRNLLWTKE